LNDNAFQDALWQAANDPVKSAWFLECVAEARTWVFFRGRDDPPGSTRMAEEMNNAMPQLRGLWADFQERGFVQDCPSALAPDAALIARHANVILNSGDLFAKTPTYWSDLLEKLEQV